MSVPSIVLADRIKQSFLVEKKPIESCLYVWPFLIAYVSWCILVGWLVVTTGSFNELLLIPLGLVFLGHFLTFMSIFWNVRAEVTLSCRILGLDHINSAEFICIFPKEHCGKAAIVPISRQEGQVNFSFQQELFYFDSDKRMFTKPSYPDQLPFSEYRRAQGLSKIKEVQRIFGKNRFEIVSPTFMELFKEHAVAPFFVFQIFCVGLWCLDEYWYYSVFTLFMLVVFESTVVQQRLKNLSEFRSMSLPNHDIQVRRNGKWESIKSEDLLPGDLCHLTPSESDPEIVVPCDMLLIAGSCIINEAMISGESTPLLKESILEHRPEDERDLSLDIAAADKIHVLFGGTKILQLTPPHSDVQATFEHSTKNGCYAYVLRTGFGTMQGELVRTMMFSSERMSANNMESFIFIGFLLIFAIAAAGYVLHHGLNDPERNRYKLLLECVLIITAVVPPELPMELSLAVNNSLIALSKFAIFCMEPFRIPFAGKIDICCFDKTGTLTGENLVVQGVVNGSDGDVVTDITKVSENTLHAIAACHSLFVVNGQVAGDPMEKAALEFSKFKLSSRSDAVTNQKVNMEIINRYAFSSALKRMSCVVRRSGKNIVVAKGAPETMSEHFKSVPSWYANTFQKLALSGARVLALGIKDLTENLNAQSIRTLSREHVESDLEFVGFLVFKCPLKPDSRAAIKALKQSNHRVAMITGDNILTAISTARELEMTYATEVLVLDYEEDFTAQIVADGTIENLRKFDFDLKHNYGLKYSVALSGNAVDFLSETHYDFFTHILPYVSIFARTSPSQKEFVLTTLKSLGFITLMCGDGTNDVGALKQAHIGVALLDGKPEDLKEILNQMQRLAVKKRQAEAEQTRLKWQARLEAYKQAQANGQPLPQEFISDSLQQKLDEIAAGAEDEAPMVKLGDASVAAPFTSKISSIESVCNIIRQGRCTLVTTIQMYKILALNSLISAYGLSVLHYAGIRYGDLYVFANLGIGTNSL